MCSTIYSRLSFHSQLYSVSKRFRVKLLNWRDVVVVIGAIGVMLEHANDARYSLESRSDKGYFYVR